MREEVLAAVLSANKELPRDEPEVAANIGLQLGTYGAYNMVDICS
jgi:hypothetical protein